MRHFPLKPAWVQCSKNHKQQAEKGGGRLRMWHVKIEAWILEQAGIEFVPVQAGLHVVKSRK